MENIDNQKIQRATKFFIAIVLTILCYTSFLAAEDFCNAAKQALVEVESIRALKTKAAVPCLVKNMDSIREYVLSVVDQEIAPERIKYEEYIYKALGLIPKNYDYKKGVVELYTSQIGGYYDPKEKHFVMAAWIPVSLQYPVAIHELTHALQDQYYNLKDFTDTNKLTTDNLLARAALVEGDATAVMIDYSAKQTGSKSLAESNSANTALTENLISASMFNNNQAGEALAKIMVFPYTAGLRFTQKLLKKGGYAAIDQAFKNPPLSTKEILHPSIYFNKSKSAADKLVDKRVANTVFKDQLGEFFISVWLAALGVNSQKATKLAEGMVVDQIYLIKAKPPKNLYTIKWFIKWIDEDSSDNFQKIVDKYKHRFDLEKITCAGMVCELEL